MIRAANLQDAEKISSLVNSAYRGESSKKGWTTEADLLGGQRTDRESLREMLSGENQTILLLEDEAGLLGCVFLQRRAERAYLGMLTIRPDLQAAGLGRQLLTAAEDWARKSWNVSAVEMTVIAQRAELIAWYERRGYVNTLRTQPFPYGDERFGQPKVKDLRFVVLEKKI